MEDDPRVSKIEKLLAKANRAGTPEEADAFFAKAQELMTLWAIDEAQLLAREGRQGTEDPVTEAFVIKRSGYHDSMYKLLRVVSEANNVKTLWRTPSSWGAQAGALMIGFPSDIERTKMLYTSLLIQVTRERRPLPGWAVTRQEVADYRHSFSMGYAIRIGQRLLEMKQETEKKATESDGSLLPVLASRSDRVDEMYDRLAGAPIVKRGKGYDAASMAAGAVAANRADIGATRVGGARRELT